MSFFGIGALTIAAGATIYGAVEAHKAAQGAAMVDRATGALNQRYDQALANQLDLDTQQNVRVMRQESDSYLSRQQVSYASAGVLADTGSALATQIVNAGRFEQQAQQKWTNATRQEQQYYSEGAAGRLSSEARAVSDTKAGTLSLINGGANLAGLAFSSYKSGVFKGLGKSSFTSSDVDG